MSILSLILHVASTRSQAEINDTGDERCLRDAADHTRLHHRYAQHMKNPRRYYLWEANFIRLTAKKMLDDNHIFIL